MNSPTLPGHSVDESRRRRFEDAWRRLGPQPIELFLPPAEDSTYLPTLAELVLIEMEFTWKVRGRSGDLPRIDDYVRRFPALGEPAYLKVLRAHADELRDRIESPTIIGTPSSSGVGPAPATPGLPGYDVLGFLGRGGMGVVYKARHVALNRIVAVKMLRDADESAEVRERFRIEAAAVAALRHPYIVQLYEVGEFDGRPYFTLEFVAGGSLDRRLAGVPQPARPAARLVALVARAVQHAHEAGVVHRDLKPANILLESTEDRGRRTENQGRDTTIDGQSANDDAGKPSSVLCPLSSCFPKVTDFGLARRMDSAGHTKTGDVIGTPCYMAPEQAAGRKEIGPAVDIYALGAILYECLTGRPPFHGVTSLATLGLVLTAEPVPPSRLQPGLPRDLETVCLKCLAKEPSRRYATAAELADDLERFLADRPVLARPAGRIERVRRWARRNPAIAGLAAALLLVVIGGVIGLTALWLRAEASAEHARREAARADANFQKARGAVEQLLARVGAERLTDAPHMEQVRRGLLEDALTYYQGFLAERADDPGVVLDTARAYRRVADIQLLLGRHGPAEDNYRRAIALLEPLAAEQPTVRDHRRELEITRHHLGNLLIELGRSAEATAEFRTALDVARGLAAEAPDDPEYQWAVALTLVGWGSVVGPPHNQAAMSEAADILGRLAAQYPGSPNFRLDLGLAELHLGLIAVGAARPDEAERRYRSALAVHERLVAEYPTWPRYRQLVAADLHWIAKLLTATGRFTEGEAAYRRAVDLYTRLTSDYPGVLTYRVSLAQERIDLQKALTAAGRKLSPELVQAHRDAVTLTEKLVAEAPQVPRHRDMLATSVEDLGYVENAQGRSREAEAAHRRAIELFGKLAADFPRVGRYREQVANNKLAIASQLIWTTRKAEAENLFKEAVAIAEALVAEFPDEGSFHHLTAMAISDLAVLMRHTDRVAEAGKLYDRALAIDGKLAAEFPTAMSYRWSLVNTRIKRGIVLVSQHRHAEAEQGYREAIDELDRWLTAQPRTPKYLSSKAGALDNMAESLIDRGEPRAAKAAVEQAIALEREALKEAPKHPEYLRFLSSHYEVFGRAQLGIGDHAGAAATAHDLAREFSDDARQLRIAAGLLARCASLKSDEKYVAEALDLLRAAVKLGFKDAADLRGDPYLAPLRGSEAFRQVVAEAEKKH